MGWGLLIKKGWNGRVSTRKGRKGRGGGLLQRGREGRRERMKREGREFLPKVKVSRINTGVSCG